MKLLKFIHAIFFIFMSYPDYSATDIAEECKLWSYLEGVIHQNTGFSCKTNIYCSGINCSGKYMAIVFKVNMWLEPCLKPIKAVIVLEMPALVTDPWRQEFVDGDKIAIPGAKFSLPQPFQIYLKMNLKQSTDEKFVEISVSLLKKVDIMGSSKWSNIRDVLKSTKVAVPICKDGKPVTPPQPTDIPTTTAAIPSTNASTATPGKVVEWPCDLRKLFTCGPDATCQQLLPESHMGKCICLNGFTLDTSIKECMNSSASGSAKKTIENSNSYIIVISTVVPIVALLFCALIAFMSVHFRWWQRVRGRFHVRVYDQMLIAGPQDAEDDDPVA